MAEQKEIVEIAVIVMLLREMVVVNGAKNASLHIMTAKIQL